MTKLEQKKKQLAKLLKEVRALEDAHRIKVEIPARQKLIGTCWRYRNSYSCPQSEADKWWMYRRFIGVDGDGHFSVLDFQRDKYGKLTIEVNETVFDAPSDGWQRMSRDDWDTAWRWAQQEVHGAFE